MKWSADEQKNDENEKQISEQQSEHTTHRQTDR